MDLAAWGGAAPAVTAAFLASLVEVVEAFTLVLAAATLAGWRPALLGAGAATAVLAILVLSLGALLADVPLRPLQFVVGVLLLLFGMRWLRKAVLRAAGILPQHDEEHVFATEAAQMVQGTFLEGLEVAVVVTAVGAPRGQLWAASLGALAATAIVLAIGLLVHRPLSRVPENALKLGVGVLLSAFGVYWTGEGLGIAWPGEDLASVAFAALFLATALALAAGLRRLRQKPTAGREGG